MLKRFSLVNFASFMTEQVFDLTAGSTTVLSDHYVKFDDVKILKSAAIYGANASGKSNLIKAIDFAKSIIQSGLASTDTYKKHFRLEAECINNQSSFDFEIEIDGAFYSYGFSAMLKSKKITEEWLYEIGKRKSTLIFERNNNDIKLGKSLTSPELKGRFEIYQDDMTNQTEQLFLSEIASKGLMLSAFDLFNSLYAWFTKKLVIIYPEDNFMTTNSINADLAKTLTKYLNKFDTGIVDVDSIDENFEDSIKDMPDGLKNHIEATLAEKNVHEIAIQSIGKSPQFLTVFLDDSGELKVRKLGLVHGNSLKETFELKDESDGTRRLLDFIPLISKFDSDITIIIDEFDRSLHSKLTREFFNIFHSFKNKKSQLIVTTHESTLLDLDLLRRDEIWFVEKESNGSSKLYSLNKFKIRFDCKVEKAYLLGRYGAIPIFSSFDNLEH